MEKENKKIVTPSYYKNFKCIASECEDTCCAGWGIVIDEETQAKYEKVEGSFKKRLEDEITEIDGEHQFKLKGERCTFLNDKNLCDIYINLGEEGFCYTCREFPRFREEFLNIEEIGISLSCREAARHILRDRKQGILIREGEEELEISDETIQLFLQSREIIINFINNRRLTLSKRCAIILMFVNEIQDKLFFQDFQGFKDTIEDYKSENFIEDVLKEIDGISSDVRYENIHKYIEVFQGLTHINENDPLNLQGILISDKDGYIKSHKNFDTFIVENEFRFENLLIYFIYRYYMKGLCDYDLSSKVKLAVVSFLIIREMGNLEFYLRGELALEKFEELCSIYSKDIEHAIVNIEELEEIFETREEFDLDNLIGTL
ncbi:MAG: flagellin lysine-N-methylase [Clostridium sp.]